MNTRYLLLASTLVFSLLFSLFFQTVPNAIAQPPYFIPREATISGNPASAGATRVYGFVGQGIGGVSVNATTTLFHGFAPPFVSTEYIWTGAVNNVWTNPMNWSPNRTNPTIIDILRFSLPTNTPTGVITEQVQKVIIDAGADVTLAGAATTLSISTDGITIPATSSLALSGVNISLNAASTMLVQGRFDVGTANFVSGAGNFTLAGGATLITGRVDGINGTTPASGTIQATGTITYSPTANYEFTNPPALANMNLAAVAPKPAITQAAKLRVTTVGLTAWQLASVLTLSDSLSLETASRLLIMNGGGALTLTNNGVLKANSSLDNFGALANSGGTFRALSGSQLGMQSTATFTGTSPVYDPAAFLNYFGAIAGTGTELPAIMPGGVVLYTGASVALTGAARTLQNTLLLQNGATLTQNTGLTVQGATTLGSASQLNLNGQALTLGTLNQTAGGTLAGNSGNLTLTNAVTPSLILSGSTTLNNLTVSLIFGVPSVTLGSPINIAGTLTLTNGLLNTTPANLLTVTNTATGAVAGGGTASYINGPLQRRFQAGVAADGTSYFYPVGDGTTYLPASMVNVRTGASPDIRITASNTGAASYNAPISQMFPRNWFVQQPVAGLNSATLEGEAFIVPAGYRFGEATAQAGAYTDLGGGAVPGVGSGSPRRSAAQAVTAIGAGKYYAFGNVGPSVSSITPLNVVPGDSLIITGTNLVGVTSVALGGFPVDSFSVVSPTQIWVRVGAGGTGPVSLVSGFGVISSLQSVMFSAAPTITTFSPNYGTTNSTIEVVGDRFTSIQAVSVGGVPVQSFSVPSPQLLLLTLPHNGISGQIRIQGANGVALSAGNLDFIYTPSIMRFSPAWAREGDTVRIFGGHFGTTTEVRFDTVPVRSFVIVSSGQVNVAVPWGRTGALRLKNFVGQDTSRSPFTWTGQPTVTAVSPVIAAPGQEITVRGTEFHPVPLVSMGSVTASNLRASNLTELKFSIPRATSGSVRIAASGGTVETTLIQVIDPPVITSFVPETVVAGDLVTVTGANFIAGQTRVFVGTALATSVTLNSPSRMTIVVPPMSGGAITVRTDVGSTTSTVPLIVVGAPVIDRLSASSATVGQSVTVFGINFLNILAVRLAGANVTYTASNDGRSLTFLVPNLPAQDFAAITIATRSGSAARFLTIREPAQPNIPVITGFSPETVQEGGELVLLGTNFLPSTNANGMSASTSAALQVSVLLNGVSISNANVSVTSGAIRLQVPSGLVSTNATSTQAVITLRVGAITTTAAISLRIQAPDAPSILAVEPPVISTGTTLTITGQNFGIPPRGEVLDVLIGGVPVRSFVVVSPTEIRAVPGNVTSGTVSLRTSSGEIATTNTVIFTPVPRPVQPTMPSDSLALEQLLQAAGGMIATTSGNWQAITPVSERDGVVVENGRVTELRLTNAGLRGTSATALLRTLTALRVLDLSGNQLSGELPRELANMTNLEVLRLAGNQFTGAMPPELCRLNRLREVDLSNNQFSDSLNAFCCLTRVQLLNLRGNRFKGSLPKCLQNWASMETLDLTGNDLTGTLPEELGALTQLQTLNLRGNKFHGVLPLSLTRGFNARVAAARDKNASSKTAAAIGLTRLDVAQNQLSGALPEDFGVFVAMRELYLHGNNFSGNVPKSVLSMIRLRHLTLASNAFTSIPDLAAIPRLDTLTMERNLFPIEELERGSEVRVFTYIPQTRMDIGLSSRDTTVVFGTSFRVRPLSFAANNRYTWLRNGVVIRPASPQAELAFASVAAQDTGVYICEITNARLPALRITTATVSLQGRATATVPNVLTLLRPANMMTDVPATPVFAWSVAPEATQYRIEISLRQDFTALLTNAVLQQTFDILTTGQVEWASEGNVGFPLSPLTTVYWRVRAENAAGGGVWATGIFTTAPEGVVLSASSLNFGKVARTATAESIVNISNVSKHDVILERITSNNAVFEPNGAMPPNSITLPRRLAPGEILPVPVAFTPQTLAEARGNLTLNYRFATTGTTQQTRTFANAFTGRGGALKLLAPLFDTVLVGQTRVASAIVINVGDRAAALRRFQLLRGVEAYSAEHSTLPDSLGIGDTLAVIMRCKTLTPGAIPLETIRCELSTDTAEATLTTFARIKSRTDITARIGIRAVPDSAAPGSPVALEIYLAEGDRIQLLRNTIPVISGTLRYDRNALSLAAAERGARRLSSAVKHLERVQLRPTGWSGADAVLARLEAVAVAGETDRTALELEDVRWEGVQMEEFQPGIFTAKACEAGGKRLVTSAKSARLTAIAPNPAKDELSIQYTLREDGFMRLVLTDALGETAQVFAEGEQEAGEHSFQVRLKNIPSGAYTLRLETVGGVLTHRVSVVR